MAEPIRKRLDRVLDRLDIQGGAARRIVLSADDLKELGGDDGACRGIPVEQGVMGQSSFIEVEGAPSGDANFGI